MTTEYVIWSNEHRAWWGPDESGYYTRLSSAGRYSRDHALAICTRARGGRRYNDNPTEVPLLLVDAGVFWPDQPGDHAMTAAEHERRKCPACYGRGYTRCDCWPGDCICGWGDEDCDACRGTGDADWDDSWEDDPNDD